MDVLKSHQRIRRCSKRNPPEQTQNAKTPPNRGTLHPRREPNWIRTNKRKDWKQIDLLLKPPGTARKHFSKTFLLKSHSSNKPNKRSILKLFSKQEIFFACFFPHSFIIFASLKNRLEAENATLKDEFVHLQNIVNGSMTLTKLVAKEEMTRLSNLPTGLFDFKQTQSMASLYLLFTLWTFKDQFKAQQSHIDQTVSAPVAVA